MAIPDNFTFTLKNVCAEIQFSGATGSPTATLSNIVDDSPKVSFNSTYSGTTTCLRNFRGYQLMKTYECSSPNSPLIDVAYDYVNGYIWGVFGQDVNCVVRISKTGDVSGFTVTRGGAAIAFDGTYMWYPSGFYKCISRINVTTGAVNTYSSFTCCPIAITYDYTNSNMWTANNDISGAGNQYSKISTSGTITTYTCTSLCRVNGITFDGTNLWISSSQNNLVGRIDPSTGNLTTYGVGTTPGQMTFDGTYVWSVNRGNDSVSRITTGGTVVTYTGLTPTSASLRYIRCGGDGVWVTNANNCCITKISQSGVFRNYERNTFYSFGGMAYDCDTNFLWTINSCSCLSITRIGVL